MQVIEEKKTEIALAFDKEDEKQILAAMEGDIVEPYFYKFEKSGKDVTGLSYAGVRYIAKRMAQAGDLLSLDFSEVTESDWSYRGKAVVRSVKTGLIFVGMCEIDKKIPFAYILAYNKAERNGFRKHEPEKAIIQAFEEWKHKPDAVKNVTPPKASEEKSKAVNGSEKGKVVLGISGFNTS